MTRARAKRMKQALNSLVYNLLGEMIQSHRSCDEKEKPHENEYHLCVNVLEVQSHGR